MRRWMLAVAVVAYAVAPASAQNVANNNGIWWGGPAGAPSAFTFLNPLTTVYGRIGVTHAWQSTVGYAFDGFPGIPYSVNVPNAFGFVAGLGVRLMPAVRYELQLGGTLNGTAVLTVAGAPGSATSQYGSFQIMNNLYLDVAPIFTGLGRFNPYVMGGVGVSFNRSGDFVNSAGTVFSGTGTTNTVFAWNAGTGLQYQLINNLILDIGYRYLDLGRFRSNLFNAMNPAGRSGNVSAHQIMFSLVLPIDGLIRGY